MSPDTWPQECANRSKLPSIFWIYYWNREWIDSCFGSRDGVDAYEKAEEIIKVFNRDCKKESPLPDGENYAAISQTEKGETVVAVVDPFMRRVHGNIPQCGEIVLIDATSNLDRNDVKLFHLVCPSTIGALPIGKCLIKIVHPMEKLYSTLNLGLWNFDF